MLFLPILTYHSLIGVAYMHRLIAHAHYFLPTNQAFLQNLVPVFLPANLAQHLLLAPNDTVAEDTNKKRVANVNPLMVSFGMSSRRLLLPHLLFSLFIHMPSLLSSQGKSFLLALVSNTDSSSHNLHVSRAKLVPINCYTYFGPYSGHKKLAQVDCKANSIKSST